MASLMVDFISLDGCAASDGWPGSKDRICDGYPDVTLDLVDSRTFDGRRMQLLEYVPGVARWAGQWCRCAWSWWRSAPSLVRPGWFTGIRRTTS